MTKKLLPRDGDHHSVQLTPSSKKLASLTLTTTAVATDHTLNVQTRFIRVYANWADVYLKYGTWATVADNWFDEIIPDKQVGDFVLTEINDETAVSIITAAGTSETVVIEK